MARRTGECTYESTTIGVSGGIYTGLVNTIVVLDSVNEVGSEDFVADATSGVGWSLPIMLNNLASNPK